MPTPHRSSALVDPDFKPIRIYPVRPKPPTTAKKKKKDDAPIGPPPTRAESDYIQNGIQLPQNPDNLRALLQDIQKKGFFDKEFCYQLRKREALQALKTDIEDKLNDPTKEEDQPNILYKPLLEDGGYLSFAEAFRRVLLN